MSDIYLSVENATGDFSLKEDGAVATDTTLTKPYMAANAKATGDAITNAINTEKTARENEDDYLQLQINQIITPGGTPSEAEITNARIGADGTVYDNLGDAIREQVEILTEDTQPYNASEFTRALFQNDKTEVMSLVSPSTTNIRSVVIDHNRVIQTKTATSPTGSTYYSFLMNKTARYVGGNETSIKSNLTSSDFTSFEYGDSRNLYIKVSWTNRTETGTTARIPGAIYVATINGTTIDTTNVVLTSSLPQRYTEYVGNLFSMLPTLKTNKNIAVIYQSRYPNTAAEVSIELYWAAEEPAAGQHETIATTENSGSASKAYTIGDYLIHEDKLYKVTSDIANSGAITPGTNISLATVGGELKTIFGLVSGNQNFVHDNFKPGDFVQFTDIVAYRDGWWTSSGIHGSNTYARTDLIPVYPGQKYYVTNKPNNETQAVFFDKNKDFVSALAKANLVKESYQKPNGYTQSTSNYIGDDNVTGFFYFTVPENCYYVSFNFNGTHLWHWTLCSKPIFAENSVYTFNRTLADSFMNGTAVTEEQWNARNPGIDIVIPENDTAYEEYNKRKLCVIGPSTVMIDRRNPNKNDFTHYIVGWQEYLMPYYKNVISYGYSGASWGDAYVYDGTYQSIHTMITQVDLSGFDDFILTGSANGLSTTGTGDWDTATPDTDTYFGALRDTINYIYTQNSSARIWLLNLGRAGASDSNITYVETIDTQLPLMCQKLGLQFIEYSKLGFNTWTRNWTSGGEQGWTYDGTHYNQTGSKMIGQFMRHLLVGR